MKLWYKHILVTLLVIVLTISFSYFKYIKASNEIDILTKNSIFDIINSIEDIVITCISTDGNIHITEENKFDITSLYIIKNKQMYKDAIQNVEQDLNSENIIVGKIDFNVFENIVNDLFSKVEYSILDYKHYDENMVNLVVEPCNYSLFDKEDVISLTLCENGYKAICRYKRELNNTNNKVYIKYEFDFDLKIQDITILSSITN